MNEELLEIYTERLRTYDAALVPTAAAAYFADLSGALSGKVPVNAVRFEETKDKDLPETLFPVLWVWYYEALRDFPQKEEPRLRILETSIRLLCAFEEAYAEEKTLPEEKVIRDIVWSYLHDYAEEFTAELFLEKGNSQRLFVSGDPLWGPLSQRSGAEKAHAADLSLFWGDRLKAGKLEALETVMRERKEAGEGRESFPKLYPPYVSDGTFLSFTERQKKLFAEYAVSVKMKYDEEV